MARPDAKDRSGLVRPHKICRQLIPYPGIDQHRVFTELSTESSIRGAAEAVERLLALCNPDQAVPGDDGALGGHDDVAKADQL